MSVDSSSSPTPAGILPSNAATFQDPTATAGTTLGMTRGSVQPVAVLNADRQCPSCHRSWGAGRACQFCSQVEGLPIGVTLASPAKRLGAHVVDGILVLVTLFVGYLIWALISFGGGRTPGKQLLGMRYVHLRSGRRAG